MDFHWFSGKSRMENQEKLATLGTQDENKQTKKATQKTKKMSNTDPHQNPGANPGDREE
jgi:hypothetical protein